jgi:hypothetical protein
MARPVLLCILPQNPDYYELFGQFIQAAGIVPGWDNGDLLGRTKIRASDWRHPDVKSTR